MHAALQTGSAYYFSASGLAWDAMLKMTGVQLELMVEQEFHDIIDKGPEAASTASVGSLHVTISSVLSADLPEREK